MPRMRLPSGVVTRTGYTRPALSYYFKGIVPQKKRSFRYRKVSYIAKPGGKFRDVSWYWKGNRYIGAKTRVRIFGGTKWASSGY